MSKLDIKEGDMVRVILSSNSLEEEITTKVLQVYHNKLLVEWDKGISHKGSKSWWIYMDANLTSGAYYGWGKLLNKVQHVNEASKEADKYSKGSDGETLGPSGLLWL